MKITFIHAGEYKNEYKNVVITEEDVEDKKIFDVFEGNAKSYIKAGHAVLAEKIEKEELPETDIEKMNVKQLEEFAAGVEPIIDLSEAKNKAEKLEVIKAELEARELDK